MKTAILHPLSFILLTLSISGGEPGCAPKVATTPPNILFLIADDWSYPHAGAYGNKIVRTPVFNRLAGEGALFQHAYCASPSCSPSRAAILTGRYPHQLESAGNLWSVFPSKFPNWVSILEEVGYFTGKNKKGWGPGDAERGGYRHNPAGPDFASFDDFMEKRPKNMPFCFWFGSYDPHRVYETNTGIKTGMSLQDVVVPGFLPDMECIRNDILDYYFEVERFDRHCGAILRRLEEAGELDNTLIVMTGDNGMPFPRAKANVYDYGTRMPLAMSWKGRIAPGTVMEEFMNFVDFGPTFLEAAGLKAPASMAGRSLLPLLTGNGREQNRSLVFLERERHANARRGDLSYPMRAVRTKDFLYIRNFEPGRWPAGDPETHQSVGQYGDVDNSISKFLIMDMEGRRNEPDYFLLAFGKRPADELYRVTDDPFQLNNLAENPTYGKELARLRNALRKWMKDTGDLRATEPHTIYWDTVEYTPDYSHENFNLQEEIGGYLFMKPDRWMKYLWTPCK